MKPKFGVICILIGSLLAPVAASYAQDVDRDHPGTFIKDSAITSLVKTKLAAEKFSSLTDIKVDTDDHGVVWLTGTAASKAQVDRAEAVARSTDGVRAVKNRIVVKTER